MNYDFFPFFFFFLSRGFDCSNVPVFSRATGDVWWPWQCHPCPLQGHPGSWTRACRELGYTPNSALGDFGRTSTLPFSPRDLNPLFPKIRETLPNLHTTAQRIKQDNCGFLLQQVSNTSAKPFLQNTALDKIAFGQ